MNINWSSLTKEQKQIAALIGVGAIVLLVALYQFVLRPMLDSAEQHKRELTELRGNLEKATKALEREMRTQAETAALKQQLEMANHSQVAPFGNTLSWVTEQIYQTAKDVGVEIDSVAGGGLPPTGPADSRTFTPFIANATLQCNYASLLRFIETLEQKNPFVIITTLSVEKREQKDHRQQVSLTIEWPAWVKAQAAPSATNSGIPKSS